MATRRNKPPEVRDFGDGVLMVNTPWVMEKFGISCLQHVAKKMRDLNVKPIRMGRTNFYALRNIHQSLEAPAHSPTDYRAR